MKGSLAPFDHLKFIIFLASNRDFQKEILKTQHHNQKKQPSCSCPVILNAKSIIFTTKAIIFNAQFIIFNAKYTILNTNLDLLSDNDHITIGW